ncbi:phage tail protein [Pseudomonas sp. KU26590]|uniref:phage tail protein n=1 Tax=Pseudomonas sp. KU26590 TaxID=2991051 RepID=UPI00223E67B7|nr:phage tail protein [Pseudomonas sp. KU26590]UZJ58187.1 phage tail protein [Pseudomonas sp. KU26590]
MSTIDWSKLITRKMKAAAAAAQAFAAAKVILVSRNAAASEQIRRVQDRIDTLGYGIDIGAATEQDEVELAALTLSLKAWKSYKFALGKVATQATWPSAPNWPAVPAAPEIAADPLALAPNAV